MGPIPIARSIFIMWLLFIILQFLSSVLNAAEPDSLAAVSGAAKLASEGAYLSNQGHFKQALGKFKRALKIDPENASLCLNLGLVYQKLKNYKKALSFLEKAAVLDPKSARVQYSLALLYEAVAVSPGIFEPGPSLPTRARPDADPSEFWEKARVAWVKVIKLEKDASKRETARKHIKRIMIEAAKQSRKDEDTGGNKGGGPPETGEQ